MNKTIFFLAIIFIVLVQCKKEDCPSLPEPPYGTPDTILVSNGPNGYKSVNYIYYCYKGRYINIDYTQISSCTDWGEKIAESNCVQK